MRDLPPEFLVVLLLAYWLGMVVGHYLQRVAVWLVRKYPPRYGTQPSKKEWDPRRPAVMPEKVGRNRADELCDKIREATLPAPRRFSPRPLELDDADRRRR